MDTAIVLAMHGAPPRDFPEPEMAEYFSLHLRLEHAGDGAPAEWRERVQALETRMRAWPRNSSNDPFWAASHDLGRQLAETTGIEVVVGFNEFCGPSVDEAIDHAVSVHDPARIVVITPMLTRGGEHAELDIPAAIARSRERHPGVPIIYAWPFAPADVAGFLATKICQVM
jgi:sirohydrochlorin cobaltochelatase